MAKQSKRKRRLPRNVVDRPDSEIMERIFGKRVKRELDKMAHQSERVARKGRSRHPKP